MEKLEKFGGQIRSVAPASPLNLVRFSFSSQLRALRPGRSMAQPEDPGNPEHLC